jgi:hypothetical protein
VDEHHQRRRAVPGRPGGQGQPAPQAGAVAGPGLDLGQRPGHRQGQPGGGQRRRPLVGGGGVEGDRLGRGGHGGPQGVQPPPVRGRAQVGEGAVGAEPGHPALVLAADLDPEHRGAAVRIGDEEQGPAVGRPHRLQRPQVEPGGEVAALAAGQVDQPQADVEGVVGVAVADPLAHGQAPVGGAGDPAHRRRRVVQQHPALAAGHVDRHQPRARVGDLAGVPAAEHGGAVGGDGHVLLVQGPARRRGQRPARGHPALPAGRRGGREQPRLPRPQVMVPVADRVGLEQQGGDPGVAAGRLAALVGLQVVGPGVDAAAVDHGAGVAGHPDKVDPGRGAGHRAGLAAAGRQQPQPRHLAVRLGVAGGLGVVAAGGEQQRPVGQEGGAALARGRPGEPPGGGPARRVELPQGGGELLAVRRRGGHRGHQPAAVRGQGQPGHPGQAEVAVEVEGRLGRGVVGHGPESRSPPPAAQRRPVPGGAGHRPRVRVRVPGFG